MAERRVPRSLSIAVWQSFLRVSGPLLAVLGVSATLLTWIISRDATLPAVWCVLAATLLCIIFITLLTALLDLWHARYRLPSVRMVKPSPYADAKLILLLENSDLFAHDMLVSVYELEQGEYESLIGVGRVVTVQDNGLVQVALTTTTANRETIVERLLNNDRSILGSIVVKPHVPTTYSRGGEVA